MAPVRFQEKGWEIPICHPVEQLLLEKETLEKGSSIVMFRPCGNNKSIRPKTIRFRKSENLNNLFYVSLIFDKGRIVECPLTSPPFSYYHLQNSKLSR